MSMRVTSRKGAALSTKRTLYISMRALYRLKMESVQDENQSLNDCHALEALYFAQADDLGEGREEREEFDC